MDDKPFENNVELLEMFFTTRDKELRDRILLNNQELVWYVVKRYTSAVATREDMFQAGIVGLLIAIERFDPRRGTQLSTYAVPYIQNEIRGLIDNPDYIDDHVGLEPVDIYQENPFRNKLNDIYQAILTPEEREILDIVLRTNDEPAWSINDIAKQVHMSGKRVRELYTSGVNKLNQPWVQWYIKLIEQNYTGG